MPPVLLAMHDPKEITKNSRSNLAFALAPLPRQRREDMVTFYAFCRIVDDIADDLETPPETKKDQLAAWGESAAKGFADGQGIHAQLHQITQRYQVPTPLFLEIIEGVGQDIEPQPFPDHDALLAYCYKVACAVGLVSIRIFGCQDPAAEEYAINLGYALQLTNILRDVGEDLDNEGRIYLPQNEIDKHGYSEAELRSRTHNPAFLSLMETYYQRALAYFDKAGSLVTPTDRRCLVASQGMAKIYRTLLESMHKDGFRVFDRRYRLSRLHKARLLLSAWIESRR